MAKKKKKLRLSAAERKRRSLQAIKNFRKVRRKTKRRAVRTAPKKRRKKRKVSRTLPKRRRTKSRSSKKKTRTRRVSHVARKKRSRSRSRPSANVNKAMMGAAIVAVADPIVDTFIDKFAGQFGGQLNGIDLKDLAKMGLGWWLARRGRGTLMKSAGFAWAVIGTNNVVKGVSGKLIPATT